MSILEHFKKFNGMSQQQELLAHIAKIRGYSDNSLFNYAVSVQIRDNQIQQDLLSDTTIYRSCFHSQTGESLVYGKLLIPGFAPSGELITYICYSAINQVEAKARGIRKPAYFYPEQSTSGGRKSFVYAPPEAWEKIIQSKELFIVDGVWDSVALNMHGVPTVALLGSSLSSDIKHILSVFDTLYLVMDNDKAGSLLYQELLRVFKRVFRVVIPPDLGKDADDYIRVMGGEVLFGQLEKNNNTYLGGKKYVL